MGLLPNELLNKVGLESKLRFPNRLPSEFYGFAAILKSIFPGTDWLMGVLLLIGWNDPNVFAFGASGSVLVGNKFGALFY